VTGIEQVVRGYPQCQALPTVRVLRMATGAVWSILQVVRRPWMCRAGGTANAHHRPTRVGLAGIRRRHDCTWGMAA
jgi:hypothetical protein